MGSTFAFVWLRRFAADHLCDVGRPILSPDASSPVMQDTPAPMPWGQSTAVCSLHEVVVRSGRSFPFFQGDVVLMSV